ncbi:zinc-binding alcohol dehydrogenase family protein [Streptomyces sp. NPDC014656]|uniref:quinone oxidoreductase family protein n=1 Tax=Streptomyces sp. NPDC014656 TaxID=3364878 RepID=UPI00370068BC
MSSTMTALYGGTGPEWELREVPVPTPGPGQVLVRARAAALNHADAAVLAAADPTAGGTGVPYLAGYEFAGEVVALGEGAAGPGVGTRVMGTTPGSFAQYVLVDHRHAVPVPGSLGYEEAAALPTGLLTEHGALMSGGFEAGQSVLITGATSSVGLIGVQAAKALGASTVVATTRTAARGALLREIGADEVVAAAEQNLTEAVLELTCGEGVDLVLDHVGGRTFADCLPATRVDGSVVNIGRLDRAETTIDLDVLSYRHLRVRGVSFGFSRPEMLGATLSGAVSALASALLDGRVQPLIDSKYDFRTASEAVRRLASHQALGKIVLAVH